MDIFYQILPYLIGIVVLILLILLMWKKVPADKARVITGLRKRVLSGRGGIQIPFFETSCTISLEAMSMQTDVIEAPAKGGIFVNITGTAVVKIDNNHDKILIAAEQFCNGSADNTTNNIKVVVEQILEGKLRGIVSTLSVEQINEDRVAFESSIEESITNELNSMGLKLLSYTVLKISTQGGYLENRAIPQIAASKSDADIAQAERKRDTEIKTAVAIREGEKARLNAQADIAESERDKQIRTEQYRAEQDKAKANADIAYKLQEIDNNQFVAQKEAELAKKQAVVVEEQLVAKVKKPADAKRYETEVNAEAEKTRSIKIAEAEAETIRIKALANAEAKKIEAEAEAQAIRARGSAEAQSIKDKGIAEAEAKDRLAEAMKKYGEAAVVEMLIDKLPDIMEKIASPMSQIDKITVIDNGSGTSSSNLVKTVTDVAGKGFEVIKDLTGLDVSELITTFVNKEKTKDTTIVNVTPETSTNYIEENKED